MFHIFESSKTIYIFNYLRFIGILLLYHKTSLGLENQPECTVQVSPTIFIYFLINAKTSAIYQLLYLLSATGFLMSSIEPLSIDSERHCRGHGVRVCHFPGRDSKPMEIGANAWVLL